MYRELYGEIHWCEGLKVRVKFEISLCHYLRIGMKVRFLKWPHPPPFKTTTFTPLPTPWISTLGKWFESLWLSFVLDSTLIKQLWKSLFLADSLGKIWQWWRVQFRQTQTLIQKRRRRKNYFRLRVTLKFYQTGKMFSKFLTNILALEWEIIHLRCYSYSEIIVVKKCKFSSSCAALVREGLGPSSTFKMADAGKLKEL